MTPKQIEQELKQELLVNTRIADLLKAYAKLWADKRYRNTKDVVDFPVLIKLTCEAQAVEAFTNSIVAQDDLRARRPNKD